MFELSFLHFLVFLVQKCIVSHHTVTNSLHVKMPLFVSFTNFYGFKGLSKPENKINTKHVQKIVKLGMDS
jgi:hypothetical protein